MQDTNTNTNTNTRYDQTGDVPPPRSQAENAPDGPAIDLPTIATLAVHNTPPWAGDIIASIPEEASSTPAAASPDAEVPATAASVSGSASQPGNRAASAPRQPATLSECPLHTAMRHLAEAAVAQHVLYLEGEVRARPGLVNTVARWERMHTLIRECVCPATREIDVGAPALAEIVDSTLEGMFTPGQQHLRTQFVRALEVCAACASAAECPLSASPDPE